MTWDLIMQSAKLIFFDTLNSGVSEQYIASHLDDIQSRDTPDKTSNLYDTASFCDAASISDVSRRQSFMSASSVGSRSNMLNNLCQNQQSKNFKLYTFLRL